MINKRDLKDYNFRNIDSYYDYVLESHINGQFKQVETLIQALSKNQKKGFIKYIDSMQSDASDYCFDLTLELL